jgi:hypothetical protein
MSLRFSSSANATELGATLIRFSGILATSFWLGTNQSYKYYSTIDFAGQVRRGEELT